MIIPYAMVFLGGGFGAMARFGLSALVSRYLAAGSDFPWGTLAVNLIGALAMGMLIELVALRVDMPDHIRLLLVTGFLGGFTTFSAFSLESTAMLTRGDYVSLAAYIALSVAGTIALVILGMMAVRVVA